MSDEHQSIRALRAFRAGKPVTKRDWQTDLSGDAWKKVGSVNRPPLAYAAEFHYSRSQDALWWWMDWCESQQDSKVGHGGRELGSRIYDSWTVTAVVMTLAAPAAIPVLANKLRRWLRRHWLLQALGAAPRSQGQPWYRGPSVTWTGMRSLSKKGGTAVIRGEDNELDAMFALALGLPWSSNREKKMVGPPMCRGLDMGLTPEDQAALRSLISGQIDWLDAIGLFRDDLEGLVTRVPMEISRWADGSVGSIVFVDIGTSTPPVYGMLIRGHEERRAEYLTTHKAGDKYKHGIAGESDGTWWARAGSRLSTIPLPAVPRLYSVRVDENGFHFEGDIGKPSGPPIIVPPAILSETQTPRWQLEAAIRALDGGNIPQSHQHTAIAERMLRTH